jgi:hypothetical protein
MGQFQTNTRQGVVSIQCDDRLKAMAEIMLSEAVSMDQKGGTFRDGLAFLHGWSAYKLRGRPGLWRIEEPDFGGDPYANSRPDITFTLSILAQQFAVGEKLGLRPSQLAEVSCFDMILHPSCLRDQRIRAERVELRGQKFSGWQLFALDRKTSEADDMVSDVATLVKARPALLRVMLLPVGYSVEMNGNEIRSVTDPSRRIVYQA